MLKAPIEAYFASDISHIFTKEDAKAVESAIINYHKLYAEYSVKLEVTGDLDSELTHQARIYGEITEIAARVDSTVDMLKLVLSTAEAYAALKTREAYEDDEVFVLPFKTNNMQLPKLAKATEAVIETAVTGYDIIYALNFLLIQSKAAQAKFRGLDDSWMQRSISVGALSSREVRMYGMPDEYRVQQARDAMDKNR